MSTSYGQPTSPDMNPNYGGGAPQNKEEMVPPPYNQAPQHNGYAPGQQNVNQGYQQQPMIQPGQQYPMQPQQGAPPPQVTVQAVTVVASNQGTSNMWYQSFCGCFDNFMICLATFCFPECVFFCIAYYAKQLKYFIISYALVGAMSLVTMIYWISVFAAAGSGTNDAGVWGSVGVFWVLLWIAWGVVGVARVVLFAIVRLRIRETYNIRGTVIEDCFFALCCPDCVTCQMMAEIDHQMDLAGEKTIFNRT